MNLLKNIKYLGKLLKLDTNNLNPRIKLLVISAMTMAVFTSFSIVAFPKIFNFWGFKTTCGDFFFPITYTLTDMLAFFYGRKIATFVFVTSIVLDICFSLCGILLYYIPADPSFKHQAMYYYIFVSHGIELSTFAALGVYLSQKLNITLFFSKFLLAFSFPFRSTLSSVPSDFLVSIFAIAPALSADHSLHENMIFVGNSVITKCIISTIYAFIAYTIIRYLRSSPAFNTSN